MLAFLISAATFIYLCISSLFVLLQDYRSKINILLASGIILIGLWLIGVAGLSSALGLNLIYGRWVFAVVPIALQMMLLFVTSYTEAVSGVRTRASLLIGTAVGAFLVSVVTLAGHVLARIETVSASTLPVPVYGPLFIVYAIWVTSIACLIFWSLLSGVRQSKGLANRQIKIVMITFAAFMFTALMTNLILPQLLDTPDIAQLTPLSTIILAYGLSYAVVRHRFLNIRLLLARTVSYFLTLGSIAFVYFMFASYVVQRYLEQALDSTSKQVFLVSIIMAITLSYGTIKKSFDKLSNKIFYRDAYEPQALLDELNTRLISSVEVETLLGGVAGTLTRFMKCRSVTFAFNAATEPYFYCYGATESMRLSTHKIAQVEANLKKFDDRIVFLEEARQANATLAADKTLEDAELAIRISNASGLSGSFSGLLLVGYKKNGSPYTKEDVRVLGLVASACELAIQNALRFDEIENFSRTLEQRVEDATKELRKTNEKLKALDESKDDFISMASHQLRTPLTSVKGYVSLVLDGDAGRITGTQRKLLMQAFTSAQRMVYIIADLLNVSRLKTGKFIIDASEVNLADIVTEEIAQVQETAESRELTIVYEKPAAFPTLKLDETKMRQVVMNFLDNAIYYTPAGGTVTVTLLDKPKTIECTITDTGIGVPKQDQHRLFTKFYRAQNAQRARPDGTGLGLFMAKKVVVTQGGSIIFKSAEGKGSTFGFILNKEKLSL